jgi:hypothetical protein
MQITPTTRSEMNFYLFSPSVILFSVILYHFSQKSVPQDVDPWIILGGAYLLAFVMCVGLLVAAGEIKKGVELFKTKYMLLAILLAVAAIGVEFGYLPRGLENQRACHHQRAVYQHRATADRRVVV